MAKAKKKSLPKDFEALLKTGDLDALKAVFDTCEPDARGGVFKQTALAFSDCPDDLARWLIDQGADISATDSYGKTPLHARAGHWQGRIAVLLELGASVNHGEGTTGTPLHEAAGVGNAESLRLLLKHGAHVDAVNAKGWTPLEYALRRSSNARIKATTTAAAVLIDAGAQKTEEMKELVAAIGATFEFHRKGFHPESVDAASDALDQLYVLFDVPPAPRRAVHDGKSPIVARADRWENRHQELWQLLVPSSGAAETVQGEVIRISGRIHNEFEGNGGVNWDAGYKKMADAFVMHVGSGKPLAAADLAEIGAIVSDVKRKSGDTRRLCELAVAWVGQNPEPLPLTNAPYER